MSLPRIRSQIRKMSPDEKVKVKIRIQDLIKEAILEKKRDEVRDAVLKAIQSGIGDMEILAIAHQVITKSKRAKRRRS